MEKRCFKLHLKPGKKRHVTKIDSRKQKVPKNSGFHAKKPTSGFDVPTGSGKVPYAIALDELYLPSKFHPNQSIRIGGGNIFNI